MLAGPRPNSHIVLIHAGEQLMQNVRRISPIGVNNRYEWVARLPNAGLECRAVAPIVVMADDAHSLGFDNFRSPIGGAIVHDDQFVLHAHTKKIEDPSTRLSSKTYGTKLLIRRMVGIVIRLLTRNPASGLWINSSE